MVLCITGNWYVVNTGLLCPVGWQVPTMEEWKTLINYLGGETVAGDKLKDPSFWFCPQG
ncbi:MAG: FISUMP domain-containing protein [Bacteroidales bacterium]